MSPVSAEFALTERQQARLLACRASWEEGENEERLARLRQKAEDTDTLRAIQRLLEETRFAAGNDLTYTQCGQALTLVRALAPNPNLDARLLRRPGEPEALNRDLRDLLFGKAVPALRLRAFLARRHAGGQTALQLLCTAFPQEWPLVTQTALRALELAPEQRQSALRIARERYDLPAEPSQTDAGRGLPDSDPVLRLLAEVVIYEAVRNVLESEDYLETHRLLTQGLADRPRRARRFVSLYSPPAPVPSSIVREETPTYEVESPNTQHLTPNTLHPSPDVSSLLTRDILRYIEAYVTAQGFTYPALTLRDYYIALQTRPFCIVSGITGTGKTRLTSLFAEALTGDAATHYRLLPVRPDWADSTPLLGYVNLLAPNAQGDRKSVV